MNCELPRGICLADRKLASGQRFAYRISWSQRRNCHANEILYLRERKLQGCYVTSTKDDITEMYTSTTEWAQQGGEIMMKNGRIVICYLLGKSPASM